VLFPDPGNPATTISIPKVFHNIDTIPAPAAISHCQLICVPFRIQLINGTLAAKNAQDVIA
jgi:hypothetical protein